MVTIKNHEAEFVVFQGTVESMRFTSNLWKFQETFRQLLGPTSKNTHFTMTYNGITRIFADPTNWDNPTCCAACREAAKSLKLS